MAIKFETITNAPAKPTAKASAPAVQPPPEEAAKPAAKKLKSRNALKKK